MAFPNVFRSDKCSCKCYQGPKSTRCKGCKCELGDCADHFDFRMVVTDIDSATGKCRLGNVISLDPAEPVPETKESVAHGAPEDGIKGWCCWALRFCCNLTFYDAHTTSGRITKVMRVQPYLASDDSSPSGGSSASSE